MPLDNPGTGIGAISEFQSSALPWVTSSVAPATGSPVRLDFPKVTRFISVSNTSLSGSAGGGSLSFGFTRNGVKNSSNKYVLGAQQQITLELRVKSLFLQGETGTPSFSVCAGLTTIDARNMPQLSGTLDGGGAGWSGVG